MISPDNDSGIMIGNDIDFVDSDEEIHNTPKDHTLDDDAPKPLLPQNVKP